VTIASASAVSVLSVHVREQLKISLRRKLIWSAIGISGLRIRQGQENTSRTRRNVKFSMMVPSRVKGYIDLVSRAGWTELIIYRHTPR